MYLEKYSRLCETFLVGELDVTITNAKVAPWKCWNQY